MVKLYRLLLSAALVICACVLAGLPAAANDPVRMRLTQIDQSKFPEITAYVSVTDAQGKPVTNLRAANFTLTEDNREVAVRLSGEGGELRVVLVIDQSGSMADAGKMIGAQNAARAFISQLGAQDQAAIVSFNSRSQVRQQFTSNKTALISQIDALRPDGGTALYDALNQAVGLLAQTNGRKAVVALTDGKSNAGTNDPNVPISAAMNANVPIYMIGLGSGSDIDEPALTLVADRTGAAAYFTPNAAQLQNLYELLGQQIRGAYPLVYTSPRNYQDGTRRNVEVTLLPGNGTQLSAPLIARSSYLVGGILGAAPPGQPGVERVNLPAFGGLLGLLLAMLVLPVLWIRYRKRSGRVTRLPNPGTGAGTPPVPMPVAGSLPQPPVPMPRLEHTQPQPMPMPTVGQPQPQQASTSTNGHHSGAALAAAPAGVQAPAPARLNLSYPLNKDVITIGRDPANDIVLAVRSVASRHAEVRRAGDRYSVHALAADAPVYVSYQGDPAHERQVQVNAVKAGSTVRVGTVTLIVTEATLERHIPFAGQRMTIGSGANADVQIHEPGIAPVHAAIEWETNRYVLVDLAESSPSRMAIAFAGNESAKRTVHGRNALRSGSVIFFGQTRMTLTVFEWQRQ